MSVALPNVLTLVQPVGFMPSPFGLLLSSPGRDGGQRGRSLCLVVSGPRVTLGVQGWGPALCPSFLPTSPSSFFMAQAPSWS